MPRIDTSAEAAQQVMSDLSLGPERDELHVQTFRQIDEVVVSNDDREAVRLSETWKVWMQLCSRNPMEKMQAHCRLRNESELKRALTSENEVISERANGVSFTMYQNPGAEISGKGHLKIGSGMEMITLDQPKVFRYTDTATNQVILVDCIVAITI